jgi:glycosyltransferase involved in cell wall biosynthesis
MPLLKQRKNCAEPWNITLWDRLKEITESAGSKVAYIYEQPDTSTFRYRTYNMCQALRYSTRWTGSYFFEKELPFLTDYLDRIDVVIFVRTRWSLAMDAFLHAAKNRKIPVIFDMDDLVCDVSMLPVIMNTLNVDFDHPQAYEYWFSYVSRLWFMGSRCDATIGTNDFLSDRLAHLFEKPSYSISNFLNTEQIQVSDRIFRRRRPANRGSRFKLGYFSGTPSHVNDFRKVSAEIGELMRSHTDIKMEVVGFMEFPDSLNDLVESGRIVHQPLVDFLKLQKMIARADVNIVPLLDNEFTNCKSELKFFEAAIVGTITCATPTYTYKNSIHHKQTGFLCKEGEWYTTLEEIYRTGDGDELVSTARDYCLQTYAPEKQSFSIEKVLDSIASGGA